MKTLLGKIDSVRRSRERGFNPAKETKQASSRFAGRVENIFNNLPKPLEWRTFYRHDLPIWMDFCEEVQEASIQLIAGRTGQEYNLRKQLVLLALMEETR
ncbi:MAG: hypothetical protein ISS63_01630 [Desulfobacteraceae bacterium]|nr:hypothetical protein [Desulfobacteraceae bacterium]